MILISAESQDVSLINLAQGLNRLWKEVESVRAMQEEQLVSQIVMWLATAHPTMFTEGYQQ